MLSKRAQPTVTADGVEMPPALLHALRAVNDTFDMASRVQERMRRCDSVHVDLVKAYVVRVAQVLQIFVPSERLQAALRAFRHIDRPMAPIEQGGT